MPCQYPRDKGDGPELCGAKAEFMRQLHGTWWEPACADCVKGEKPENVKPLPLISPPRM